MTYRVFWSPHAEQRLELILQNAPDVERITNTVKKIDRRLVTNPGSYGESRYDTVRIGIERPLAVLFELMDDVRTVVVFEVWRTDRRR